MGIRIILYVLICGRINTVIPHVLGIFHAVGPERGRHIGYIIGFCGGAYIIIKLLLKFENFVRKNVRKRKGVNS